MAGESVNSTTFWTPQRGFDSGWASGGNTTAFGTNSSSPTASPWLINDPNSQTGGMMQDPTATATPTRVTPNASGTTGILNPFGLTSQSQTSGMGWGVPTIPQPQASAVRTGENLPTNTSASSFTNPNAFQTNDPYTSFAPGYGPESHLAPPDQRGVQGTFNPQTGRTDYGQYSMDQYGNWFDQAGNPTNFNQSASGSGPTTQQPDNGALLPFQISAQDSQMIQLGWTKDASGNWQAPAAQPFDPNGANVAGRTQTPQAGGAPQASAVPTGENLPAERSATVSTQQGTPDGFNPNWQQNVTSSHSDNSGNLQFSPANSRQFADDPTAQRLAQNSGGTVRRDQLSGPGMGWSTPMNMIDYSNGRTINAGLAADILGRKEYGSGKAGSYGEYLVNRDINPGMADPWAQKINAPQPLQSATLQGSQSNTQGDTQNQFAQFLQALTGQQQQQQQQRVSVDNNIYSQLAPILSLLQSLGLFSGQQQARQRPQPLQSLYGNNYYSRFA